jgi:hypothetical protein
MPVSTTVAEAPAIGCAAASCTRTENKSYLAVASREGCVITHTPLDARWPDYEAARREARKKHPRTRVIVPDLGERPPTNRKGQR